MSAQGSPSLDHLKSAAAQHAAERASTVSNSVIVRVECAGEFKKLALNNKASVAAAIELCQRKFKFTTTDGFQLFLGFPSSVQLKESEPLERYKLKTNDDLEFKLPKGMRPPASGAGGRRAITTAYSTEGEGNAPPQASGRKRADTGGKSDIARSNSTPHSTTTSAMASTAASQSNASNTSSTNDGSVSAQQHASELAQLKRKLELVTADLIETQHKLNKSESECENAQLLYMAEKEKTEKLLVALRESRASEAQHANGPQSDSPIGGGAGGAAAAGGGGGAENANAIIEKLKSELAQRDQVIAEQQMALDEMCGVEQSASAAAAAAASAFSQDNATTVVAANVEVETLRMQLDATSTENIQLRERMAALEDRLGKLVTTVKGLMDQNKLLKNRRSVQY